MKLIKNGIPKYCNYYSTYETVNNPQTSNICTYCHKLYKCPSYKYVKIGDTSNRTCWYRSIDFILDII